MLDTADGERIGAWLFRGRDDLPSVVLLHGKGGTRSACLPLAERLVGAGYTCLAVTMRGHGDSSGEIFDFGRSEALDVVAAVEFFEALRPGGCIVVRGASLGAAAAVFAASRLGERVSGYVLECLYRDLGSAALSRTRLYLPPLLDLIAYKGMELVAPWILRAPDEIAPIRAIRCIPQGVPVLLLVGGKDEQTTADEARDLYDQIRSHGELVIVPDGSHDHLMFAAPALYTKTVLGFLERVTEAAGK